jgi:CARDB
MNTFANKIIRKNILKIAAATCLTLATQNASAYNYISRACGEIQGYNNGHIQFQFATNLSSAERAEITEATRRVTEFSDSSITIVPNLDTNWGVDNNENEIFYDATHGTAQCALTYDENTCTYEEVDMRFGDEPWTTGEDSQHHPYINQFTAGSGRQILGTAVHEAGHCIGVGHENDRYNAMGDDRNHVTRNSTNTYYGPGEDLSDALIDRWGKRSTNDTYRDVGVTVMRYNGMNGEYSTHKFGVLLDLSGSPLSTNGSYEGQTVYNIVAGETVQMELTFENNGEKNTESAHVGFYLSTNDFISTSDTLLGTDDGYSIGRGLPYEVTENVTIPVDTPPGNYFLGAYVDHDNLISETTSANNIAWYPVTILPPPPDLTVIFAGVTDTTLLPGQSFSVLAITRNVGDGPASSSTLRYYRSSNSIISTGDTYIGTDTLNPMAAGAQQASNDPETALTAEGNYWYGACVLSVPGEEETGNQCSTGAQATVAAQAPLVTNQPITNIQLTEATLNATVTPQGASTTLQFAWGANGQATNLLNYGVVGSGISPVNVNTVLDGLVCGTDYVVLALVTNSKGSNWSTVQEFTTPTCGGCE